MGAVRVTVKNRLPTPTPDRDVHQSVPVGKTGEDPSADVFVEPVPRSANAMRALSSAEEARWSVGDVSRTADHHFATKSRDPATSSQLVPRSFSEFF